MFGRAGVGHAIRQKSNLAVLLYHKNTVGSEDSLPFPAETYLNIKHELCREHSTQQINAKQKRHVEHSVGFTVEAWIAFYLLFVRETQDRLLVVGFSRQEDI